MIIIIILLSIKRGTHNPIPLHQKISPLDNPSRTAYILRMVIILKKEYWIWLLLLQKNLYPSQC